LPAGEVGGGAHEREIYPGAVRILHVHCLHSGEWESYWPQAREEIRVHGRVVNQFPVDHNGAWIWTKVLRELGQEVEEFDYRSSQLLDKELQVRLPFTYGLADGLRKRLKWLEKLEAQRMNRHLLERARACRPDLFITYPGERIFPETIRELQKKLDIRTVLWLGRDPVVEGTPNVVESFPYYDYVFTIDPPNVEKFRTHGARRVFYLPLGCDPAIHRRFELSAEDRARYAARVAFVGTLFDSRPAFLSQLVHAGVEFWTHSWSRRLRKAYPELVPRYRGKARGRRMLKVLNGAEVVINVHRSYNSVEGTNMRSFEAAGCRAFQIAEYKKEIGSLFEIGQEIEVYHGIEDLKEKIRYYLDRPKEREEIALRGQKRAYANHTYRQRFRELLEIVAAGG
jgi:spore maturation protein CgeB